MFMFVPITIDMFSCLCGPEVTQQTAVPEVPDSISGSDNDFFVFCLFCCCVFTFFGSKTVICHAIFCDSFYNDILFSVRNILHNL